MKSRSTKAAESEEMPGAAQSSSALTRRQSQILQTVQRQGFATIDGLARHFAVSAQTIRRDVICLDEARLLQRFHGGAGLAESTVRPGHALKQTVSADAKERIAAAVADRIPAGASVFLDVGTTAEAVARALRRNPRLSVFTCSLAVAMILADREGIEIFVTGGLVRGADGSLIGDAVLAAIARFKFDYAVIGCSGFDEDGAAMDFDMQKVAVKQAALSSARTGILVADRSKIGRTAIVRVGPLSAFRFIATDAPVVPSFGRQAESAGAKLIIA